MPAPVNGPPHHAAKDGLSFLCYSQLHYGHLFKFTLQSTSSQLISCPLCCKALRGSCAYRIKPGLLNKAVGLAQPSSTCLLPSPASAPCCQPSTSAERPRASSRCHTDLCSHVPGLALFSAWNTLLPCSAIALSLNLDLPSAKGPSLSIPWHPEQAFLLSLRPHPRALR